MSSIQVLLGRPCVLTSLTLPSNTNRALLPLLLLSMQSAVLARAIPSVCLSVRPSVFLSVTLRYYVQTNEDTIVRGFQRLVEKSL